MDLGIAFLERWRGIQGWGLQNPWLGKHHLMTHKLIVLQRFKALCYFIIASYNKPMEWALLPHFVEMETETQRGVATWLRSNRELKGTQDLNSGLWHLMLFFCVGAWVNHLVPKPLPCGHWSVCSLVQQTSGVEALSHVGCLSEIMDRLECWDTMAMALGMPGYCPRW